MRTPRIIPWLLALALAGAGALRADPGLQRLLASISNPTAEPAETATTPETRRLTEADLVAPVAEYLTQRWALEPETLQIQPRNHWNGPLAASANTLIEVHSLSAQSPASSAVVRGVVSADGRVLAEFAMPFTCELPRTALVATRRLSRGEALDLNAFQIQTVDALRLPAAVIDPEGDLGALELVLPVKPGQALTQREVGERPLVRKGAVVEVQVQRGPLSIRTQALALENGRAGEFISLRNLQSRRDFKAEVIHENQVRIRL